MRYEDFRFLLFDPQPDGVLLVTLNRPEALNATNDRMHWELTQVWGVIDADPGVKVAVVTGAGDRAFSAGGDLSVVEEMANSQEATLRVMKEASAIVYNMLSCDKPIISAINGVAVGAGLAVALLADASVMAKAKYYLMTADFLDGREAERIGLVTFCAPRGGPPYPTARIARAARITGRSTMRPSRLNASPPRRAASSSTRRAQARSASEWPRASFTPATCMG